MVISSVSLSMRCGGATHEYAYGMIISSVRLSIRCRPSILNSRFHEMRSTAATLEPSLRRTLVWGDSRNATKTPKLSNAMLQGGEGGVSRVSASAVAFQGGRAGPTHKQK